MVLPVGNGQGSGIVAGERGLAVRIPDVPDADARALAAVLGLPPLLGRLLWVRGLRDRSSAAAFLAPRLSRLEPPERLPDMEVAAARVVRAIASGERIAVCGDYDVDGMTGTALLVRFLRLAGADVVHAIPDRVADGYGLSAGAVERLCAGGVRLAVTVDNGVSAHEALSRAKALGMDVVVTDHHRPGPTLPPAVAIVDPQRTDGGAGGGAGVGGAGGAPSLLCGCGMAFKLAWAVADRLPAARRDGRLRDFLRDAVALVALATIADVVPLVGENRVLVHAGLEALTASTHAGLRALRETAGIDGARVSGDDVVWRLAPRLNAAGRLNRPELAIELLTTDDLARARELAAAIEAANEERRAIEKGVVAAAHEQARARLEARAGRRSLVVAGEGWHRGVIGIVAARLVDAHRVPVVVIGLEADGGRGSCRAPDSVDLFAALSVCAPHLKRFGGHAAAAGLELERGALEAFAEAFEEAVETQREANGDAHAGRGGDTMAVDAEAEVDELGLEVAQAVARLAPFGAGNPEPRVVVRGAAVAGRPRLVGAAAEHLAFTVRGRAGAMRVVAFRQAKRLELVASGAPLDLVVSPTVNAWRGVRTPELVAHAIARS